VLIGLYLVVVAASGYYVRELAGNGACAAVGDRRQRHRGSGAAGFFGTLRSQLKVFLGKNLFRYRYDYRREWLRFTTTLVSAKSPQDVGAWSFVDWPSCWRARVAACGRSTAIGLEVRQMAVWNMPADSATEAG